MKKLTKLFSILILTIVCSFSFIACSNNENKQASQVVTTDNISDTGTNQDDNVAEHISDEGTSTDEEQSAVYPITSGIYKFEKDTLTFDDIYYEDEAALCEFFKTKDLNGVYDFVYKAGFEDFAKSITTVNVGNVDYKVSIVFHKNESDGSQLGFMGAFESYKNTFTLFGDETEYDVIDGKIIPKANKPEFVINAETNDITILFPFSYYDSNLDKVVHTPLYIKANVYLYSELDIMQDDSFTCYSYLTGSAKIVCENDYLSKEEAMKKLTEILPLDEDELVEDLDNIEFCINDNKDLFILYYEETMLITNRIDNSNNYLLFNSVKLEIVNEYYDITLGLNVLTAQIEIEENVYFRCNFVA